MKYVCQGINKTRSTFLSQKFFKGKKMEPGPERNEANKQLCFIITQSYIYCANENRNLLFISQFITVSLETEKYDIGILLNVCEMNCSSQHSVPTLARSAE